MFNSDFATELKAGTKDGASVSTFLLNYAGSGRLARAEYASTPATASTHGFALIEWAPPTSIVLAMPRPRRVEVLEPSIVNSPPSVAQPQSRSSPAQAGMGAAAIFLRRPC